MNISKVHKYYYKFLKNTKNFTYNKSFMRVIANKATAIISMQIYIYALQIKKEKKKN